MKILLIEDNPRDARLLMESLAEAGGPQFEIAHAACFGDAQERLKKEAFEVLLLDLFLPDARGMETLRRAVKLAGAIPILTLVDAKDESLGGRTLRNGAADFLVKSQLDGPALARTLAHITERQKEESPAPAPAPSPEHETPEKAGEEASRHRKTAAADSTSAASLYRLALMQEEKGQYPEAAEGYQRVLDARPDFAHARLRLAVVQHRQRQWEEAVTRYEEYVTGVEKERPEAWFNLGLAYQELGRTAEAAAAFEQTAKLAPELAEAHWNLGVARRLWVNENTLRHRSRRRCA